MVHIDPSHAAHRIISLGLVHRRNIEVLEAERQTLGRQVTVVFIGSDRHRLIVHLESEDAHEGLERRILVVYLVLAEVAAEDARLPQLRLEHDLADVGQVETYAHVPSVLHVANVVVRLQAPSAALTSAATVLAERDLLVTRADHELDAAELITVDTVVHGHDTHPGCPLFPQNFAIVDVATPLTIKGLMDRPYFIRIKQQAILHIQKLRVSLFFILLSSHKAYQIVTS